MKISLSKTFIVRCGANWANRAGLLLAGLLLLTGCPAAKQTATAPVEGKLVIKGSNTIGEELAPRLIEEFKKTNPKVTVDLESKGTGSGFAALLAGEADIAAASRVANPEELTKARASGIEFNMHTLGSYGVAVVVNRSNAITNLSRDQVREIFAGKIQNWKELGGVDAAIMLCIRGTNSGAPLGFQELAMDNQPYAAGAKPFMTYEDVVTAVSQDGNAIGYASFELAGKSGVKSVAIRGVVPTAVTVNEGQYPISRVLRLYTNKTNETVVTQGFIEFAQSPKGQKILNEAGFIPRL